MKTILASIAFAILFTGCASTGRKIDMSKVDQIKKGETTKQQVIQLLGSPEQMTSDASGNTTFLYLYSRATTKGQTFIPIVGAFAGGANVQSQMVSVIFGPDGKVSNYTQSMSANDMSTGANSASKASMPQVEDNKREK